MGIPAEVFWDLSLIEYTREMDAARQRRQDDLERDLVLAWQIKRMELETEHLKRLPDLASLLRQMRTVPAARPPQQTEAQMRAQIYMLSQYLGIPVKVRAAQG